MEIKNMITKLFISFLFSLFLCGCTHHQTKPEIIKSVQIFQSNAGSNYLFENNKNMEKKHDEQN